MTETTICILGAGPGGVATALQLAKLNIPSVLVDKAIFPRDKVCGDAISGKVVYAFNRIDEMIFQQFADAHDIKVNCWGVKFVFQRELEMEIKYKADLTLAEAEKEKPIGFVAKRIDFDNFLVNFVRKESLIDFREGIQIKDIQKQEDGFILKTKDGSTTIQCQLLIAADGAQSQFARKYGGIIIDPKHYAASVRAYFSNVKDLSPFNDIEIHFIKEFAPGYLWIFPLPNGQANVGAGIRTDAKIKDNRKIRQEMLDILHTHPRFKDRFKDAKLHGELKGFGLPLGSKKRVISGANYMLVGDAASLIDPLTGEGIGNAAISGRFAALQAAECLKKNDYSALFMSQYDKMVYGQLWKELKMSVLIQKGHKYPWLSNRILKLLAGNQQLFQILLRTVYDKVNLKKQLRSPGSYIRFIFGY